MKDDFFQTVREKVYLALMAEPQPWTKDRITEIVRTVLTACFQEVSQPMTTDAIQDRMKERRN